MDAIIYSIFNGIVRPVADSYNHLVNVKRDPRTDDWFLVKSPGVLLTILGTYIYFCVKAGPRFMKDKKPLDFKYTLVVYNFIQVLFSIFILYEGLLSGWLHDYNYTCQPVDYSMDPKALRMASAVWLYYIAKLTELLDTVFFVLRKKNNQISFLHLYHHFMMPICSWIGVKYLPGGHGTLLGVINTFVHIWMYSYYLIASLGPQYQKYLWWKRHLTELQMIQFCIVFFHSIQVLFRQCNYPKPIAFLLTLNAALFLYMFGKFYLHSYTGVMKKKNKVKVENNNIPNGKLKSP